MKVFVDSESGCCHGVVRAIEEAEKHLSSEGTLLSLGAIVHNNTELERLCGKGLKIIDYSQAQSLHDETILIRAHGEPPSTYLLAKKNRLKLIDCTCPVVLKLQKTIRETYLSIKKEGGSVVIFGKEGHAEVNGLVGQVDGDAVTVQEISDIENAVSEGKLDISKTIALFSQTTKNPLEYLKIGNFLKEMAVAKGVSPDNILIFNTICRQVSSRHSHLAEFAASHSVILFVCGKESSNGKILFELCRKVNPRSHKIENVEEILPEWFSPDDSVGICGATSTPKWQLEKIADRLRDFN